MHRIALAGSVLLALLTAAAPVRAQEDAKQRIAELFESSFAYETTGNTDRALNSTLEILRLSPQHYMANLRTGWLYYLKGRYDESIKFYRQAMAIKPKALEPQLGLLLPLMAALRWADAEVLAQEALKNSPRNYTAASRLAFIYFSQGKHKEAEKQYQAVIEDYPSEVEMMLGLGWTYLKQGRKDDARAMFEQVLSIRRQNLNALAGMEALR